MTARIGINFAGIDPGRGGGEYVVLRNFIQRVPALRPETQLILFTDSRNHDALALHERVCVGDRGAAIGRVGSAAKRSGVDVLLSPLDTAPAKCPVRLVPIVLSLFEFESHDAKSSWFRRDPQQIARQVLAEASKIVVPSEFLRRRLLTAFEVPINRTTIAPLGVAEEFGTPQDSLAEKPFLLFVGKTSRTKNIPLLRDVFAKLREEFNHALVVVGPEGDAEPAAWGERVIRIEYVPSTTLAGLFQHCDALVYPALYDGSGLTVLEAMRAGAPIVTARAGAIPEVAGDVPMYANAESSASFHAAVRRVITEESKERAKRIQLGKKTAAEFTWDRCIWKILGALAKSE